MQASSIPLWKLDEYPNSTLVHLTMHVDVMVSRAENVSIGNVVWDGEGDGEVKSNR